MNTKRIFFIGFLTIILFSFSCRKYPFRHEVWIYNATNNIIDCKLGDPGPFETNNFTLPPFEKKLIYTDKHNDIFEVLSNNNNVTSVSFYNQKDTVIWNPPLQEVDIIEHNFFNKRSWIIDNSFIRNKEFVIATFTITEDDFKKD